jgi:hypothetical protein
MTRKNTRGARFYNMMGITLSCSIKLFFYKMMGTKEVVAYKTTLARHFIWYTSPPIL